MHSILHSSVIVFSHCFHVTRHLVAFPNAAKPTGLDETMLVTRSALRYDAGGHPWLGLHCLACIADGITAHLVPDAAPHRSPQFFCRCSCATGG